MEFLHDIWAFILYLLDIALHIDVHLRVLVESYGPLIYLFLFIVVFCETGLVVTPFLPGDSLLFAGGTLVGAGMLGYVPLVATLLAAAILGVRDHEHFGHFAADACQRHHAGRQAGQRKAPVEQWSAGATGLGVRTIANLLIA